MNMERGGRVSCHLSTGAAAGSRAWGGHEHERGSLYINDANIRGAQTPTGATEGHAANTKSSSSAVEPRPHLIPLFGLELDASDAASVQTDASAVARGRRRRARVNEPKRLLKPPRARRAVRVVSARSAQRFKNEARSVVLQPRALEAAVPQPRGMLASVLPLIGR